MKFSCLHIIATLSPSISHNWTNFWNGILLLKKRIIFPFFIISITIIIIIHQAGTFKDKLNSSSETGMHFKHNILLISLSFSQMSSIICFFFINFYFSQKNSFEDDYTHLRKTKSAENIRCPQIVINQVTKKKKNHQIWEWVILVEAALVLTLPVNIL